MNVSFCFIIYDNDDGMKRVIKVSVVKDNNNFWLVCNWGILFFNVFIMILDFFGVVNGLNCLDLCGNCVLIWLCLIGFFFLVEFYVVVFFEL